MTANAANPHSSSSDQPAEAAPGGRHRHRRVVAPPTRIGEGSDDQLRRQLPAVPPAAPQPVTSSSERPATLGHTLPVLPEHESPAAWGDRPAGGVDDEALSREVPPHWRD